MTTSEKAKRYDALQAAIRITLEQWEEAAKRCMDDYNTRAESQIGAFSYGKAEGLRQAVLTVERWKE